MKLRILLAGLICGLVALGAENGLELFQKAVTMEKANGNLEEAIKLYQRVAKEFSSDRALAAKALIQAAHSYELLGQDEQAVKIYEQVTRDFGDQRQPVETARAKLASLRFEVASVGKTMPDARGGYSSPRTMGGPGTSLPSEINYVNLRLETLIETAYDLKEYQLVGPDWLRSTDSEPFFISATIRQGATLEQVNQMLRNLLAEQFKLTVHRETRDLPFYELALVRRGPKLKESLKERAGKDGESLRPARLAGAAASLGLLEEKDGFLRLPAGAIRPAFGGPAATWATPPVQHAVGGNQNIAGLVTYLSHASELYYGRPVVDKTGLTGNWDYNLEYAQGAGPANSPGLPSDSAPDLITAVRDQLGFKMEPKKGPIEVLVVDHIEKTFPQVFEVASIKAAPAPTMAMISSGQMRQRIDDGLVDLQNISLMNLISMAYETNRDYITGPSWLENQNFSVTAKLPAGSSKSQVPAMLQRMLAERFKLEIHHSEKVQPVYLLTVAKQGLKFKESTDTGTDAKRNEGRPGAYFARSITMAELAQNLTARAKMGAMMQAAGAGRDNSQRDIDLPVLDQTGLSGVYDIDLVWDSPTLGKGGRGGTVAPSNPQAAPAADIFKALESVGLKLEQAKHAFDVLVVEHVEKVPTEN